MLQRKILTAAVVALLGGMTGISAADYTTGQVISGAKTYADDATIDVYHNTDAAGFKVESGTEGKAANTATVTVGDGTGTIHIKTESSDSGNSLSNGIWIKPNAQLTINGNLDISSVYGGSCFANGIAILNMGTGEGEYSSITVNGNVTIGDPTRQSSLDDDSSDKNWGVSAAEMHGGYGPDGHVFGQADNYTGARWSPTGISITCNGKGSTIDLNGSLYLAMRGTALKTDPYYQADGKSSYELATINVNKGDVTIYTPESETESYHAAASYGGTINVNMNDARTGGAGHNVVIQGNILAMKDYNHEGQPYFYQDGRVNLALDTKKSTWTGVVDNCGNGYVGEINLWLQNEATWRHRSPSVTDGLQQRNMPSPSINHYGTYDGVTHVTNFHGGTEEDAAGNIFTDSDIPIQIENYDGYANVYYAHTGNGTSTSQYTGGNITIKKVSSGAYISLITDNSGIDMTNEDTVSNVLKALAGKLTYSAYANGERNLSGYVKIAEGLTASSAFLKTGNLSFTDSGVGTYQKDDDPTPDEQTETDYNQALTGDTGSNQQYVDGGVMKEEGKYKFLKSSTVTVDSGAAVICTDQDISINAKRVNLTVKSTAEDGQGIEIAAEKKLSFDGKSLIAEGNTGADVAGTLSVEGDFTAKGTEMGILAYDGAQVTIDGATTATGDIAIAATDDATKIALTGEMNATGTGAAVSAGAGATVTQTSGAVNLKGAVSADGGTVEIHGKDVSDSNVTIKGDLDVSNEGNLTVDIIGKNSQMSGAYKISGGTLTVNAYNGSTWTVTDAEAAEETAALLRAENSGNAATLNLNGGKTQDATGNLAMEKTEDMTVSNYSGWMNVYYAHDNKGQNASDYKAGHIVLENIAEDSGLILSTNDTLEQNEKGLEEPIEKIFTVLAPKLKITGDSTQKSHLTGKVLSLYSPSGLTASSVEADGKYYIDQDGYGQYLAGSVKIRGKTDDYETYVMKGIRSAATVSLHSWRDNSQDTYRAADLVDENGIFAKILGGKTQSDVRDVKADNSYKGIQVGYDKLLKNGWHTGVAFDYRDGDSDYLLGGNGDDKLYSLGIYGVKRLEDNRYVRVAAKIGRVNNKYDVYTENRLQSLHGDYGATAYALTAEYGKTYQKSSLYVTPKIQLTWSHVGGSDYTGTTTKSETMNIYQDAYQSFLGRVGVEVGIKKVKGSFYSGLYFAHEFSGDISARYYAADGGWKSTSFDGNDSWAELVLGGSYQAGERTQIYADFARDFGGDFEHKWKLDAGVRYSF